MNFVEPILFQSKLNPLALAISIPGAPYPPVTYGMLHQFIRSVAMTAIKMGVAPGQLVSIYINNDTILHLSLILWLAHIGAISS